MLVIAGDDLARDDFALAHEILGHKKPHENLSYAKEESYATEEGLLAIRALHPDFYSKIVKRIKRYQTKGPKGLAERFGGWLYFKNVNLKKLE